MYFVYILTISLVTLLSSHSYSKDSNVMIIDSSFAPLNTKNFSLNTKNCPLIDENNGDIATNGSCYNINSWETLKKSEKNIVQGYLDSISNRKESDNAKLWQLKLQSSRKETQKVKSNLKLLTHGSRSAYLLHSASNYTSNPLLVRNISTQVGNFKIKTTSSKRKSKYKNGCPLNNWSKNDLLGFLKKGRLQSYQERISKLLKENKKIKIISLSLGYKHSWIAEDNPTCNRDQVSKEYLVLTNSWRNLMSQFPDKFFVTAIGNEGIDFSQETFRQDDLWGNLSKMQNLILVGSINKNKKRAVFSNYGLNNMLWGLGRNVEIQYPTPWNEGGYKALAHGTSASAPLIAGKLLHLITKQRKTLTQAIEYLKSNSSPKLHTFKDYEKDCKTKDVNCLQSLNTLLQDQVLWGDLQKSYKRINTNWYPAKLKIVFSEKLQQAGRQSLKKSGQLIFPTIELNKNSNPHDILITLSHELQHVVDLEKHLSFMKDTTKVSNCLTKFQLLRFKDEKNAFDQEISFWNKSPEWFKKHFTGKKNTSRIFNEKISNVDYYEKLSKKISNNKNFILEKYIQLKEVPTCASKLIEI